MPVAAQQTDPTRTKTVRKRFASHLRGRFDAIRWHINRALIDRDVFGLSSPSRTVGLTGNVDTDESVTPPPRAWASIRDAEATQRFGDWLSSAMEREILEKYEGDTYVRQGYAKGVQNADTGLRKAGLADPDPSSVQAVIRRPVHRDELERIYTRTYQSLDGVTEATANQMRRELTDGLARGENPRDIARSLNDRVDAIGKTRSTVVTKTSVIRAHSEGTLSRYEQVAGDIDVTVKAEHLTAQDRRVCDECAALEGQEYTIKEARGRIPIHPQCRCSWLPVQKT